MNLGLLKELKPGEGRVALTPDAVAQLTRAGVAVFVQSTAGVRSGVPDALDQQAGASILPDAPAVFDRAQLLIKVKEIHPNEVALFKPHHVLFTYLHARMFNEITAEVLASGCTALAYEEVLCPDGSRPLLVPMSEIAGKLGFLKAIEFLQSIHEGPGLLPVSLARLSPLRVLILGAGIAGVGALTCAYALGNSCDVVELNADRRAALAKRFPECRFHESTDAVIRSLLPQADVLLNAASFPSHSPTHLVTRAMLSLMKPTALIIDVACDIAGAIETPHLPSPQTPINPGDGIRHNAVDNIPGAVPATSTRALSSAIFPYVHALATLGLAPALHADPALASALVFANGKISHAGFAEVLNVPCHAPLELI